ncbi:class I SAM-dependent methyltransferase, partial [Candidatus Parvarchaeota archaeon]|nr:class I SAM-dependent methyltransferase [Candidatus Parvarchaeota archaeon]
MPQMENCRICNSSSLYFFLKLGPTPLANRFIKPGEENLPEPKYPLDVCLCSDCGLVQLGFVVPPEILFRDYIYFSSTSDTAKKHFAALAGKVAKDFASKGDLVVEIASNDGVLLKNLLGTGIRPLGVEPATNIAKVASEAGVETLNEFFNSATARKIHGEHGPAKVILANNVFAHIADLNDCVLGMQLLLGKDGVAIIEFPHLYDLYENLEFDTVYHEHLSYFSLKPLMRLFSKFDMEIFRAEKFEIHGGTLRIYVQKKGGARNADGEDIARILAQEEKLGLYSKEAYQKFAKKVEALKTDLVSLLSDLKSKGKRIAIYSAPAKGNTLLNYCGIGLSLVDFAVDK